jgi:dihydropteroate synthase
MMVPPEKTNPPGLSSKPAALQAGRFCFPLGRRTYIMGILNVTPDSFSDGSLYMPVDLAVRRVADMLADGADIIDIGGESTRPGCEPVSTEEELNRVMPVLEAIIQTYNCPVSIDTAKTAVAEEAMKLGACMVNDINGLQKEPQIANAAFRHKAAVVMMHNARLYRQFLPENQAYPLLMPDILSFLEHSIHIAESAGLQPDQMVLDPGVGFGVNPAESIQMIAKLPVLQQFHLPILLGPSRKRFIGHILDLPVGQRLHGTSAAVAIGIANGADIVRVHDVREMAEVARVTDALCRRTQKEDDGNDPGRI